MLTSLHDLRYAFRQLRRNPGFALVAILTLALGIGANTAIFSVVDSVLLQPLPLPHPESLAGIDSEVPYPKGWVREIQRRATSFSSVAAYSLNQEYNVTGTASSDRSYGSNVTINFFDTLGTTPYLGRFFTEPHAITGQDRAVVLSYGFWQDHFGADRNVLGKSIQLDGTPRQVIGVTPPGFHFPDGETQFWLPVAFDPSQPSDPWEVFNLTAVGRLRPGVSTAKAQAELRTLQPQMLTQFPWRMPDNWANDMTVHPLLDSVVGDSRQKFYLLLGAVSLVLLIACANVANLLLARAASRQREIAMRSALGATVPRLIRQLLTESVLLSSLAGGAGLFLGIFGLRALKLILPPDTPRLDNVSLHPAIFLFAAAISLVTGILSGLAPAWNATADVQEKLRASANNIFGTAKRFSVSSTLVVSQIALVVIVITAAGVMLRSLYRLVNVDPGFKTTRMVAAQVSLDSTACAHRDACTEFFRNLVSRAQSMPGVKSAIAVDTVPLTANDAWYVFDAEGHPRQAKDPAMLASGRVISNDYFQLMGIALQRGRLFDDTDASGSSRAVIVNTTLAARVWPNQDPIGKRITHVADEPSPGVLDANKAGIVVGVVSDTRHQSLDSAAGNEVYLPLAPTRENPVMNLILRSDLSTRDVATSLRNLLHQIDPTVTVSHVRTLDEVLTSSTANSRALTFLLLAFAILACGVGAMGIYSLIAYTVSWRTREIGLRLALGATRKQIASLILRQSLVLSMAGSLIGLAAAFAARNLLRGFLFRTSPTDPITFVAVPLFLCLLAIFAAWIPARRATRVDPMQALRFD